jgi:hypothetical protein
MLSAAFSSEPDQRLSLKLDEGDQRCWLAYLHPGRQVVNGRAFLPDEFTQENGVGSRACPAFVNNVLQERQRSNESCARRTPFGCSAAW